MDGQVEMAIDIRDPGMADPGLRDGAGPGSGRRGGPAPENLARVLLSDTTPQEVAELICRVTVGTLECAAGAGITADPRAGVAGASGPTAADLDALQETCGRGPCLEAVATGAPQRAELVPEGPWPELARAALDLGVGSVVSHPLIVGGRILGSLNVYLLRFSEPAPEERAALAGLVEDASHLLANALDYARARAEIDQLGEAVASRDVIGQAKGILMATQRCDADEAFQVLRRASQRSNRKLRDVAGDLARRASRAGVPAGGITPGEPGAV